MGVGITVAFITNAKIFVYLIYIRQLSAAELT